MGEVIRSPRSWSFDELILRYVVRLDSKGRSLHTRVNYNRDLRSLECFAAASHRGPADLDHLLVSEFLDGRYADPGCDEERRFASLRRYRASVRNFCDFLVREKILAANPVDALPKPRQVSRRFGRVAQPEEVVRLLASIEAADDDQSFRDATMIELAFVTGLRVGELVGIFESQLQRSDGEWILHIRGKRNRYRDLPVPPRIVKRMHACLGDRRSGPVFITRLGKEMTRQGAAKMLKLRCSAAGIRHLNAHSFRHGFATDLKEQGADLTEIKELLGHRAIATTRIYTHLSIRHLSEVHLRAHPLASGDLNRR